MLRVVSSSSLFVSSFRVRQTPGRVRRRVSPAMGVLAFGDSSTWALQRDGSTTGALATAKARRAARFGDGKLPESREADGADGPGRAGVTPRNAWPEGTFTITYPRGYDPARGGFVRGGEGDEEARVRVEKAPARARREAEAALEARRASAEAASQSAAAALGLDEAYLERVRAQRREATRRRDERKKRLPIRDEATTSRTEMRSVAARGVDVGTAASPNASRIIGEQKKREKHAPEDEAYAALYARRAAERDAARARVAAGRAAAAKRDAASAGIRGGNNGKRKKKRREDT